MNSLALSTPSQIPPQLRAPVQGFQKPAPTGDQVADAKELRATFSQFVGSVVFGQMMSSMRSTVGEPAYFHGGRAEEMFQTQLDQTLADEMTSAGASPFAQSLFEQQFPQQAETLRLAEAAEATEPAPLRPSDANPFDQLNALPRR